ncbi:GtrA family protein [Leptospira interrogans]
MPQVSPLRHYGGFLLAGLLALTTDGAILQTLTTFGWDPLAARLVAIAIAMIVSWLINRTVTFAMKGPPSLREYARFASVSWSAQVVNYAIFSAIMLTRPETHVLMALFIASLFATVVSYFGYRYGVFSHPPTATWNDSPDQTHGSR